MTEATKGVIALIATCTIWGLSGLYYKLLEHIPPLEILAHRTLWSFIFFAIVLAFQGRLKLLGRAVGSGRRVFLAGVAALMISINWYVFINSIQIGRAVEASLGYYIFPLVAVLLGAVVLRERLSRMQTLAVALATAAVITLTAGLGVAPWIALILATSFGLYGLIKKQIEAGPVVSVTAEVMLLAPIALVVLARAHINGTGAFGANLSDSLLLSFSGLLTATPLILFSYAAKRVRLATLGLVQYINPTLQFLVATFVFQEFFSFWHAIAFAMIWVALAIYTVASLGQEKTLRKATESSGTLPTT